MKKKIGVQLFSLREEMAIDFEKVLKDVSSMGYEGIEFVGVPAGLDAKKAANILSKFDLEILGMHSSLPIGDLGGEIFEDAEILGVKTLVNSITPDKLGDINQIRKSCDDVNEALNLAKKKGMKMALHNHWWEFGKINERQIFDIMSEYLESEVLYEIDAYWAEVGGVEPIKLVNRLGKRVECLHLKDGPLTHTDPMVALGKGIVNNQAIINEVKFPQWFIVDLDKCATDMTTAVRDSYEYLNKIV